MIQGGNGRGYSRSPKQQVTIPSGTKTHATPIDLGRNYAFMAIGLANATGIANADALSLQIGLEAIDQLYSVYAQNDPTQIWSKVLPTSGSMYLVVDGADFARWVKLNLSVNTTGAVVFDVWGFDGAN